MIRLTAVCATLALLLTACAADTTNPNASGAGMNGAGGTNMAGLTGPGGRSGAGRGAPGSQEDLAQTAGDRILFDTDQSVITPPAREILERQVQWLQQNPRISIWVAGNSDERGTEEYNFALGQRRANADRDYLASRGINPGRIQTISYGKTRPVEPLSNEESWAANRNAITSVR